MITFDNPADPAEALFFEGYASAFNIKDREGDIILPNSLQTTGQNIPLLQEHDSLRVIGLITSATSDNLGLYVKGFIEPHNAISANIAKLVENNALNSLSIGYIVKESHEDNNARVIDSAEIVEISIVAIPTNEMAKITKTYYKNQPQEDQSDLAFTKKLQDLEQIKEKISNLTRSFC